MFLKFKSRKAYFLIIFQLFCFLVLTNHIVECAQVDQKITLVIAPFETRGYGGYDFADRTRDLFIENLIRNYTSYKVLERDALDRVFRELRFTLTFDNTSRAIEAGKFLGADFIILTKTDNQKRVESTQFRNPMTGRLMNNYYGLCKVTIKIVSVADLSVSDMFNSPAHHSFGLINLGSGESEDNLMDFRAKRLIDHFVNMFVEETRPWFDNIYSRLQK